MSASSKDIQTDLDTLISSKYTLPPKQFAQEELAVRQTMQKLLHVLNQPKNQLSLLATIPIESIENMTRRGQLTLVAKNLDDNFLRTVESVLKKTPIKFEKDGQDIVLSKLYNDCKNSLTQKKGKEPNFGDVLLKMYTEASPFFKKLNAILCGYNDPKTTTDGEKKLAFLLNVAIHKAGLDKRKFEVQQTPEDLYRGQAFGLDDFVKKFEKVQELHAQGKLATLSPQELAEVNIIDIAEKKILSTTTDKSVSANFASNAGVVLHVKNPQELADFYNVANISTFADEAEYVSRIPDDIAMIPISITKDDKGVSHIEVVCIHSEHLLLNNSTRMNDIRESLKDIIKNRIDRSSGYLSSLNRNTLTRDQKNLMNKLIIIINESEKIEMLDNEKQNEFLETAILTLTELYKTNPTTYQKKKFDGINAKLQDYAALVANLKVIHENYNSNEISAQERERLTVNLDGKRLWKALINTNINDEKIIDQNIIAKNIINKNIIVPIENDLDRLVDPASSLADIRQAANNILGSIKQDNAIESNFPTLKGSMNDIIASLDKIEKHEQILQNAPKQEAPSIKFKMGLQKVKEGDEANKQENMNEEDVAYQQSGMSKN